MFVCDTPEGNTPITFLRLANLLLIVLFKYNERMNKTQIQQQQQQQRGEGDDADFIFAAHQVL